VSDIVEGFLISVEKLAEKQLIGPLNLGSEDRISMGDLAREIIRISGKDIEIEFDTSHPTIIWGQALDCSLAKALLDGWSPRVSLREGLERCYRQLERQLAAALAN
jgi:GDP-D-mannose 3', 5'-epimerase